MDCVNRDMRAIGTTKDEVHDRTGWRRILSATETPQLSGSGHKKKNGERRCNRARKLTSLLQSSSFLSHPILPFVFPTLASFRHVSGSGRWSVRGKALYYNLCAIYTLQYDIEFVHFPQQSDVALSM